MSSYTMTSKSMDIHSIDIKKIKKIFEGIDFNNNKKVNNCVDSSLCQSCGSDKIVEDLIQGMLVCTCCGQVLESNMVDANPEWKQFDDDGGGALGGRCSAVNPLLPQSSLGTTIQGYGKSKLKTLHSWNAMPYRERTLNKEFKKIHDICLKNNIPKCVEDDTKIIYKIASDCKHENNKYVITRGINRLAISAGCMFLACVKNEHTRTSKEIAESYKITEYETNKGFKTLIKMLKSKNINLNIGTSKAEHFVKRYCENLKIKNSHIAEVIKISKNIEKLNIASDHTPYSVAAASILLMSEKYELKSITKKKIAFEFRLSDVTISKTYKELEPLRDILFDNGAVNNILKQMIICKNEEVCSPEVLERMKKFDLVENILPIEKTQLKQLETIKNVQFIETEQKENYISQINTKMNNNNQTFNFNSIVKRNTSETQHNKLNYKDNYINKLKTKFDINLAQDFLNTIHSTNTKILQEFTKKFKNITF